MFADRYDAGRLLGAALTHLKHEQPLVLGLPRGGVPVALEVAVALDAPLDVLVVRKIGAPMHPEFAVGAIAHGVTLLDSRTIAKLGIPQLAIDRIVEEETRELDRREATYRGGRPAPIVAGRTVVVVDDGLATGATARAAVQALRQAGARRVVVAAPVGAPESVLALRDVADEVICLETPAYFRAVSLAYRDFTPTTDVEVRTCLIKADRWITRANGVVA